MRSFVRVIPLHRTVRASAVLLLSVLVIVPSLVRAQPTSYLNATVTDLNGNSRKLGEFVQDGPVYVTFWALWCVPCLSELKALKGVLAARKGGEFTILAVNQDSPRSLAKVKSYVSSQEFPFPVVLDPNAQVFQLFNGQVLPLGVLLDREGKVVKTRTGYIPGDEQEIEEELTSLLQREEKK
jgi:thiol-disulfide isomerase/thioredoxin